ncbi:hypothetical protein H6G89_27610 [Oscillatoria sp. FACHB-1407]|uniref:hypothetical protein n=1 Tax=Oscillatoria sp. FACHB-1407 TaxID=2692847 RepID=UPI0016850D6A|nr:hypothetical protein [Oscillatoria sp. FACHB-1407]MBD2464773.1 hypothetical protein [Oscillatoria sp. FACHB-1407]
MVSFQSLDDASHYFDGSFSCSFNSCQQSTLWIGNSEGQPISAITATETKTSLILDIQISDIDAILMNVKATLETICIRGKWKEPYIDFIHLGQFESLIPLSHSVHPNSLWISKQKDGLLIQLIKQLDTQPSQTRSVVSHHLPLPEAEPQTVT